MYEFKELILPEHFRHASYGGFCVKPGMFYGVEKETGKLSCYNGLECKWINKHLYPTRAKVTMEQRLMGRSLR